MKKILSIIIPVHGKINFTKSCVNDLSFLPMDHEIILIDDFSNDDTESYFKDSKEIIYYRNPIHSGFAKSVNKGYQLSTAPNIMTLNNDIRVKSNKDSWTQEIIKYCTYSIVGPTMGQLDKEFNFIKEANQYLTGLSYMSGWCLSSSKEIFDKLKINNYKGPFSEEFGIAYFEDTDLSFRARNQGIKFQVVDIPVVHFGKQTSSQLNTYKLYTDAKKIFTKKWKNKI